MYNLLMADANLKYTKVLANEILSSVPSTVKLIKIATDGEETYKYLKNDNIDLLILDLNLGTLKYSGLEVLEKIYKEELIKYTKVIIISKDLKIFKNICTNQYNIIKIINKNRGIKYVTDIIIQVLTELTNKELKETSNEYVIKELSKLNYNFKYIGTEYIKESITYILDKNNEWLTDNLEKNVYPYVSKKHNKSIGNIKNNIVKATNNMYLDCDMNYLLKYFNYKYDTKPTPKIVISTIVNNKRR